MAAATAQAILHASFKVGAAEAVAAFVGAPPRQRDQPAQLRVGALLRRQQHELEPILGTKLGPHDELKGVPCRQRARCFMGPDDTAQ